MGASFIFVMNFQPVPEPPSTTTGLAPITVIYGAPDYVVDLHAAFADSIEPDSELVYTIALNSRPDLFATATINAGGSTVTFSITLKTGAAEKRMMVVKRCSSPER